MLTRILRSLMFIIAILVIPSSVLAQQKIGAQSSDSEDVKAITYWEVNPERSSLSSVIVENRKSTTANRASAPALSRVAVYAVGSTQYNGNWEYMSTVGQTQTVNNHGGQLLRVVVQEIGYGTPVLTKLDGWILAASDNYMNSPICINNNMYTGRNPGQSIVGFFRYYKLDGASGGNFSSKVSSINSGPTLTASIHIN